jgi:hypothetical protein
MQCDQVTLNPINFPTYKKMTFKSYGLPFNAEAESIQL